MKNDDSKQGKGKKGEAQALDYLQAKGYSLLRRNFRNKRSEIDLIMKEGQTIVFIEVKYRSSNRFGYPEEFVTPRQQKSIILGAEQYLIENGWDGNIRFDIVAISGDTAIDHFEDAFY